MSDSRLGFTITAHDVNAKAEIAALERQIKSLQNTVRSASQMGLTPANNTDIRRTSEEITNLELKLRELNTASQSNSLPAWYSRLARATTEAEQAQARFASSIAPQSSIRAHAQELSAAAQATEKLAAEQRRFASTVAPQMNVGQFQRESANRIRQAEAALAQYDLQQARAVAGAEKFASVIAPATRIKFVETSEGLRAVARNAALATGEVDGTVFAMRKLVTIGDELVRHQHGQLIATLGSSIKGFGSGGIVASGAALGAGLGAVEIVRASEAMGRWAEQVRAAAAATGTSVAAYSQLQGALALTGAKAEAADSSLRILAKNISEAIGDPASRAAQAFQALGISIDSLKASGGDATAVFMLVADAFQHLGQNSANATNLAATSSELFGRSIENLARILPRGSEGIKALEAQAAALGHTLDDETARALVETGEKAQTLSQTISGNATKAFEEWQPEIRGTIGLLQGLVNVLGSATTGLGRFINEVHAAQSAAIQEQAQAGYIMNTATGMLEAIPSGPQAKESVGSGLEGGRGQTRADAIATVPTVGSLTTAYERLGLAVAKAGAEASKGGNRRRELQAEISTLNQGLAGGGLNAKQIEETQRQIYDKTRELNNAGASAGAKEARVSYEAFSREEKNKLEAARGNFDAQRQILQEWSAEAAKNFRGQSVEYRKAMAEIQTATQQVRNQQIVENITSVKGGLGDSREEYRAFADDIAAMAKLKEITKTQGVGFDVQQATRLSQQDQSQIQGLYSGDMTKQQEQQVDQLLKHTQLGWQVTLAELNSNSASTFQQMAKLAQKAFEGAFEKVGSGLERFLTDAITKSTTSGKAAKQLFQSTIGGGVSLVGDLASQLSARALGGQAGDSLSKVLSSKLFDFVANQLTQITLLSGIFANTTQTAVAASVSAVKPEIGGFSFSMGGIVPSAAGGMVVGGGGGQIAVVHPREMVLPAKISDHILGSMQGQGNQGNMNLNYSPSVNAGGGFRSQTSAENFFRKHGNQMEQVFRSAYRNRWRP